MSQHYRCDKPTGTLAIQCPIGEMELECCTDGIHRLQLVTCRRSGNNCFSPDENIPVLARSSETSISDVERSCVEWLENYFKKAFDEVNASRPVICHLNVAIGDDRISTIQRRLREEVLPSHTTTYSDLATRCGFEPGHSRLVARAMSSNRTLLVVPCHRVLPKSGKGVGNFSSDGGEEVKAWLLRHEGAVI